MTADLHHLAAAYALDALDRDERAEFEAHLPGCEICRRDVEEFRATAGALADGVQTPPPPDLRARVLREVGETRQLPPVVPAAVNLDAHRRRRAVARWSAAAAALVLVAIGAVAIATLRGGGSDLDDVLAAPDVVVTTLDGATGSVRVFWSPGRDQVVVFGDDLPDPGDGSVYELWAIADDTPVPAGLFRPDGGTVREVVDLDDLDAAAWGVTIEPEGGSPAPTGDILYFATTS